MMDFKLIAAQKPKFVAKLIGDELMLVPLKKSVGNMDEMFSLNETAAFIFNQIHENSTEEEIFNLISAEFNVGDFDIKGDIDQFVHQLAEYMSRAE